MNIDFQVLISLLITTSINPNYHHQLVFGILAYCSYVLVSIIYIYINYFKIMFIWVLFTSFFGFEYL